MLIQNFMLRSEMALKHIKENSILAMNLGSGLQVRASKKTRKMFILQTYEDSSFGWQVYTPCPVNDITGSMQHLENTVQLPPFKG